MIQVVNEAMIFIKTFYTFEKMLKIEKNTRCNFGSDPCQKENCGYFGTENNSRSTT